MAITYEVWDMESANQVGVFQSEAEAEAFLSGMLRKNGPEAVKALSLAAVEVDDAGIVDQRLVLEGPDFIADIERALGFRKAAQEGTSLQTRVRAWLEQFGFHVTVLADPSTVFNFQVLVAPNRPVHVIQPKDSATFLVFGAQVMLRPEETEYIERQPHLRQKRFFWGVRLELLRLGVEFTDIKSPLESVRLVTRIYEDGVSQDALMNRLLLISRACSAVSWHFTLLRESEQLIQEDWVGTDTVISSSVGSPFDWGSMKFGGTPLLAN